MARKKTDVSTVILDVLGTSRKKNQATKTLEALRELIISTSGGEEMDRTDTTEMVELFEKLDNLLTGGAPWPDQWMVLRE